MFIDYNKKTIMQIKANIMLPIESLINSFENRISLVPAITEVMNKMTEYSSNVLDYLAQSICKVAPDWIQSKKSQIVSTQNLNPFFSKPQNRMPFLLQYVHKPLSNPEHVDFGDQKIFYASGGQKVNGKCIFDLPDHKDFKIYKTVDVDTVDDVTKMQSFDLMQDIFDIKTLEDKIQNKNVDDQDQALFFSQKMVLHKEYRNLLLKSLNLNTNLATSTSKTGEWQIYPDKKLIPIGEFDFKLLSETEIDKIAADIQRFFHLESLFGLNLLGMRPNYFDENAIKTLFNISANSAVIKDSVEFPSFLEEDIKERHKVFKNLIKKCYPDELVLKILQDDSANILQNENFQSKMAFLKKIKNIDYNDPILLKLLTLTDELLLKGIEYQYNPEMRLDANLIMNWLQLKHDKKDFSLNLETEILNLAKTLLQDVPHKNMSVVNFEDLTKKHLLDKSELSKKIYTLLGSDLNENTLLTIYERASDLIIKIMNDLKAVPTQKIDPWNNSSDHFYVTFAKDFLEELESFLIQMDEKDKTTSIENQLILTLLQKNNGLKVSQNSLLTILHSFIEKNTLI